MAKYHVNTKGEPGACRANEKCPFGDEGNHYDSKEAARAVYEKSQAGNLFPDQNELSSEAGIYDNVSYGDDLGDGEVSIAIDVAYHGSAYDNPQMNAVDSLAVLASKTSNPAHLNRITSTPIYNLSRDKQTEYMAPPAVSAIKNPALANETFEKIAESVAYEKPRKLKDLQAKKPIFDAVMNDQRFSKLPRKTRKAISSFSTLGESDYV